MPASPDPLVKFAPKASRGPFSTPRVAIAHDYLTQRGGAERVALELTRIFPGAPVYTSFYSPEDTYPEFADVDVRTSRISDVRALRADPRRALPLLANVWNNTVINDVDVVICSSTGWSHGVTTDALKIVYCHNPARWLYQTQEYLAGADRLARLAISGLRPALTRWDKRNAASAARYLVNSSVVERRVQETYGFEPRVVHPPASISSDRLQPIEGIEPGYLLTIGRARGYKNTALAIQAVEQLPGERLIVVGSEVEGTTERIRGLVNLTDSELRWLYANASALIACGYEDFGLTVVESFAQGTPAVCLRAGGYIDSMREGMTGEFIEDATVHGVMDGIQKFRRGQFDRAAIRRHGELFSPEVFDARIRSEVDEALDDAGRHDIGRLRHSEQAA